MAPVKLEGSLSLYKATALQLPRHEPAFDRRVSLQIKNEQVLVTYDRTDRSVKCFGKRNKTFTRCTHYGTGMPLQRRQIGTTNRCDVKFGASPTDLPNSKTLKKAAQICSAQLTT